VTDEREVRVGGRVLGGTPVGAEELERDVGEVGGAARDGVALGEASVERVAAGEVVIGHHLAVERRVVGGGTVRRGGRDQIQEQDEPVHESIIRSP
jgi:hypothetical protein